MEDFAGVACPLVFVEEEFQRRLNHALDGLTGVLTIHDDIFIFGEGSTVEEARTDHDNNFHS